MSTSILTGVVGALAASVCFGAAAVLQSAGARRLERAGGVDLRLLLRLIRSLPYLLGLGLDLLGFLFALIAMRRMPVFAVEALIASYVAVTAVLAAWLLRQRLRGREWLGLGIVIVGVALLALSAQPQQVQPAGVAARLALLVTTLALGGLAFAVDRMVARPASVFAFIGGLTWGLIPLAIRMMRDPGSVLGLLSDPVAYVVPVAGGLGLLLYTGALQRTSVVTATAMVVLGETLLPAAAGLLLLGDRFRPGTAVVATAGFLATVGGVLLLARYGDLAPAETSSDLARG